jgi:hypothetical protein
MHPHYVYVPSHRCDKFALRVRFPTDVRPAGLWKLNGEPAWQIEEDLPRTDAIAVNASGEAFAEFEGLRAGHGYGFTWS